MGSAAYGLGEEGYDDRCRRLYAQSYPGIGSEAESESGISLVAVQGLVLAVSNSLQEEKSSQFRPRCHLTSCAACVFEADIG